MNNLKQYVDSNINKITCIYLGTDYSVNDIKYLWNVYDFVELMPTQTGKDLMEQIDSKDIRAFAEFLSVKIDMEWSRIVKQKMEGLKYGL